MERFQSTIEIDAPSSDCYEKWRQFDQFPHFMRHVKSVTNAGENRWHWVVEGPLGKDVEWDAIIDGDTPNQAISWHTVSKPDVGVQGAVRFDEVAPSKTQVTCTIQYEPPGGAIGEMLAHVFSDPQKMVDEDLANFKHLMEHTNVPADKAQQGKVLQPDPFVVPAAGTAASAGVASGIESEATYGLEDSLPSASTDNELERGDFREELQELEFEENPYLGASGALYSEDLIEMRADETGLLIEETDVFTESMDIEEEDLENFYEDLDDNMTERDISAGLPAGERNPVQAENQNNLDDAAARRQSATHDAP